MVNYVRTEDGAWHRASCPEIRRPAIQSQAEDLPDDGVQCGACLADE